jgi:hypothetical protein
MKTYLLFFGKSQDFTTHAFDNNDYIEDFNTVIKDFDLLESKIFTVDDIDNKEMLAKYNFTAKNGRKYSLLKLYSFAQASSGDRIAGSIYGVALLSERDISLSKINFNILTSAKSNFAKLCLNGLKFKSSDFYDEAEKIWSAFVNHKEGNYLDKVAHTNLNISNNNLGTKGFFVKNMFEDSLELENQMNTASRIYISEDLAHLKRVHSQRGNEFKIYAKTNNGYEIYQEPKPIEPPRPISVVSNNLNTQISEVQKLKHKVSDLEEENEELNKKSSYYKRKSKKTVVQFGVVASILFLTTITFFFTSNFWSDEKVARETEPFETDIEEPTPTVGNTINIDSILADTDRMDSLIDFLKASKIITSFDPVKSWKDSLTLEENFKSIKSKSEPLGIDIALLEKQYASRKQKLDSISNEKKKKGKEEKNKKSIEAKNRVTTITVRTTVIETSNPKNNTTNQ